MVLTNLFRFTTKVLLLPFLGVFGVLVFFFIFLTPQQRNLIIKEALGSIPIVKNFVNITYRTRLNVTAIKSEGKLKTAFLSVDYLVSIQNKEGDKFISIYPFTVEAGHDLKQSKVSSTQQNEKRVLNIELPSPTIFNVDIDESTKLLRIREELRGEFEYILQPVKVALERQSKDYAVRMGILEKANNRTEEYFKTFWKDIYDEISVTFKPVETDYFSEHTFYHLPIKFAIAKGSFPYEFQANPKEQFDFFDGVFLKDDTSIIVGYSTEYSKSYRDLWDDVAKSKEFNANLKTTVRFTDPANPLSKGVACRYGDTGCLCFVQIGGSLYYLWHKCVNEEQCKTTLPDILYLSFNAQKSDAEVDVEKYLQIMRLIKLANSIKNTGVLSSIADRILYLDKENRVGRDLRKLVNALEGRALTLSTEEENDPLQIGLISYSTIKKDDFQKMDELFQSKLINYASEKMDREFLNNLMSYFILNYVQLKLSKNQIDNYISSLVQDGFLTRELIEAIDDKLLLQTFQKRVHILGVEISKSKEWKRDGIFCNYKDGTECWEGCNSNVYYDKESIVKFFSKGKETISNKVNALLTSAYQNSLIIVLARRGSLYFTTNYDAFVFSRDRLILIRNILNPGEPRGIAYSQLNPGTDVIEIDGKEYQNKAFLMLLTELHNCFLETSGRTKEQVEKALKNNLFESQATWIPSIE